MEWGQPFLRVGFSSSQDVRKHQDKAACSFACPVFFPVCLFVAAAAAILSQHQTPWPSSTDFPRLSQAFSTGSGWLRNLALYIRLLQGSLPFQDVYSYIHCWLHSLYFVSHSNKPPLEYILILSALFIQKAVTNTQLIFQIHPQSLPSGSADALGAESSNNMEV